MVKILKALIAVAEEYIGDVHTANLNQKDPDKCYTEDEITIGGFCPQTGRRYTLRLEMEDAP